MCTKNYDNTASVTTLASQHSTKCSILCVFSKVFYTSAVHSCHTTSLLIRDYLATAHLVKGTYTQNTASSILSHHFSVSSYLILLRQLRYIRHFSRFRGADTPLKRYFTNKITSPWLAKSNTPNKAPDWSASVT